MVMMIKEGRKHNIYNCNSHSCMLIDMDYIETRVN